VLALAIALVMLTVKQYTRSLLGTLDLRGDSLAGESSVSVTASSYSRSHLFNCRGTCRGILPVAWESGGIPSCGNLSQLW
jgi:hypothetical protein